MSCCEQVNLTELKGFCVFRQAAMFNRGDIVDLLVQHGGNLRAANASGETAIDLAPPSLQYKMRQYVK